MEKTNICDYCKYSQSQEESAYDACYNCVGNHTSFSPNNVLKQLMIQSGWQKSDQKPTHIILGFPGVGKTYLKEKFKGSDIKVLDSDSSNFDKSDFPRNYIEHIRSNIGKFDVILISTHEAVRKALHETDIIDKAVITVCYPGAHLKDEWTKRLRDRGNSDTFVNLIESNYLEWVRQLDNEFYFHRIVLQNPNDYLSTYLYRLKGLH